MRSGYNDRRTVMPVAHNQRGPAMQIQQMREFVAIKERGNFSRAARSLYLTQPALSRHVQEMERELGAKLLERNRHSVSPTEAGLKAYRCFKQIIRAYDALGSDIAGMKAGMTGTLRIGMLYYTIRQDFGDAMERFAQEYPNVELVRYSYQPQEVFNALEDGSIDVGPLPRANHPGGEPLRYQDILRSGMEALMRTGHPLAEKDSLKLDDLRGYRTILLRDDPYSNLCYIEALERCGFRQDDPIYTDNIDTVPFELQKGDAVYIKPRGFSLIGYEQVIEARPILEEGLVCAKSFAWRADNDNPVLPLFLEMLKR